MHMYAADFTGKMHKIWSIRKKKKLFFLIISKEKQTFFNFILFLKKKLHWNRDREN